MMLTSLHLRAGLSWLDRCRLCLLLPRKLSCQASLTRQNKVDVFTKSHLLRYPSYNTRGSLQLTVRNKGIPNQQRHYSLNSSMYDCVYTDRRFNGTKKVLSLGLALFIGNLIYCARNIWNSWDFNLNSLHLDHDAVKPLVIIVLSFNALCLSAILFRRMIAVESIYRNKEKDEYIAIVRHFIFRTKQLGFSQKDCKSIYSKTGAYNIKIKDRKFLLGINSFKQPWYYNEIFGFENKKQ